MGGGIEIDPVRQQDGAAFRLQGHVGELRIQAGDVQGSAPLFQFIADGPFRPQRQRHFAILGGAQQGVGRKGEVELLLAPLGEPQAREFGIQAVPAGLSGELQAVQRQPYPAQAEARRVDLGVAQQVQGTETGVCIDAAALRGIDDLRRSVDAQFLQLDPGQVESCRLFLRRGQAEDIPVDGRPVVVGEEREALQGDPFDDDLAVTAQADGVGGQGQRAEAGEGVLDGAAAGLEQGTRGGQGVIGGKALVGVGEDGVLKDDPHAGKIPVEVDRETRI